MNQHIVSEFYTWAQFIPSFVLVGTAILLLMADAFLPKVQRRSYAFIAGVVSLVVACFQYGGDYSNPFGLIACVATGVSLFIAFDYSKITLASVTGGSSDEGTGELYILPLIATAGICVLTQAHDLIMLFVGLEVLTLSSYVMAAYYRRNQGSVEAGVKYIILGGLSTGILVFGAAWYFGMTGSFVLDVQTLAQVFQPGNSPVLSIGLMMALGLILVGTAFKVGIAPMQMWIPDVYQGAPTPVSAFLAVGSKAAGIAALAAILLPFHQIFGFAPAYLNIMVKGLAIMAAATLLIGNLGAINQLNAKRLLAYSSIGQAGFILVFFLDINCDTFAHTYGYMLTYALATLGAFAAIAIVRSQRGSEEICAFRGLAASNPRLAFLITVFMASLAGVPLTMGFIVKLNSFLALISASAVHPSLIWLLPIMIVAAAAGFFYYFKILRAMYWEKADDDTPCIKVPLASGIIMSICAILLIWKGTLALLLNW